MSKTVEYILQLKDQFSHVLGQAEEKTENFQHTVERTRTMAGEMLTSLGIGFAVFKGFEFIGEAKEEVEKLDLSVSQVKAGLESTRGVAGVTFEELTGAAATAAHSMKFTQSQVMDMQSVLLTFPSVTKRVFGDASQAIFDMSTRLHQDLDSTAIQVGKALQDPIKGVTALRRVGVNFNETQTEMIKRMVQGGHAAQAQAYILKELQTEFAGSAKAAAEADPLFRFNKSMEELKVTVGELVVQLLEGMAPALEAIEDLFTGTIQVAKDLYKWFQKNKEVIGDISIVVGAAATAWASYTVWSSAAAIGSAVRAVLFGAEALAITALGTALEFLNAMFIASPIGWIVTIVAALTVGFIELYKHCETFRGIISGVWQVIKGFGTFLKDSFMQILKGVGEVLHGIFHANFSEIQQGLKDSLVGAAKLYTGFGFDVAQNFNQGYAEGVAGFRNGGVASSMTLWKPADTKKPGKETPTPASTSPGSKVSGQRINTFNISINGGLVHEMTFQTTNVTESYARIKEGVVRALTSAVNDSQIIGDH